jgi:hypothetical protein
MLTLHYNPKVALAAHHEWAPDAGKRAELLALHWSGTETGALRARTAYTAIAVWA